MNPYVIRENLANHIGEKVKVKIFGMRNKTDSFIGILSNTYPQIFSIDTGNSVKTFSYAEIINGEVELTFLWYKNIADFSSFSIISFASSIFDDVFMHSSLFFKEQELIDAHEEYYNRIVNYNNIPNTYSVREEKPYLLMVK